MTKFKTLVDAVKAREEDEKGFTLIELIIVIAIIGILVAIAIPVYGSIQQNARDKAASAAVANGLTMATAEAVSDGATPTSIEAAGKKAGTLGKVTLTVDTATASKITVTAVPDSTYNLSTPYPSKTSSY